MNWRKRRNKPQSANFLMAQTINVNTKQSGSSYQIAIESDSLPSTGRIAAGIAPGGKAAIVSNKKVFDLYGSAIVAALKKAGLKPIPHLIGDGEQFKSMKTLGSALNFLGENKISRTDLIVALGGGV